MLTFLCILVAKFIFFFTELQIPFFSSHLWILFVILRDCESWHLAPQRHLLSFFPAAIKM